MRRTTRAKVWSLVVAACVFAGLAAGCAPPRPVDVSTSSQSDPALLPQSGPTPPQSNPALPQSNPALTRDLTVWPFASDSPWNAPLGAGAAFDARAILTNTNSTPWINSSSYSVPVVRASNADPLVTIRVSSGSFPGPVTIHLPASARPAAGGDMHLAVISPDGLHSDEFWALDLGARTAGTYIPVDLRGSGVGIGWVRATGVSLLGGLIRAGETSAIHHALAMSLPYALLGDGNVWPAVTNDDGGAPGHVPEGSLLAIPAGVPRPGGLSPLGSAIFDALSSYGAYVVDQTGGNAAVFYAEPTTDPSAVGNAINDLAKIMPLLRRVSNNGPTAVGGPGVRLAAVAP